MLAKLRQWLQARRKARESQAYEAGFSWAAGQLLGGATVESVEMQTELGKSFDCRTKSFDNGALAACLAWRIRERMRGREC